jgi:L-rhamnose mutarotase
VERVCFLLRVKPERLDEYRARHRAVWEPMLAEMHEFFDLPSGGRPDTAGERLEQIFHLD